MTERLITLAAVKEWLNLNTTGSTASDSVLLRIINSASQFALSYLNRDGFAAQEFTQNFRGNGKDTMLLRNWPVISIRSVGVNGSAKTASAMGNAGMPGSGYFVSDFRDGPQSINLVGDYFYKGTYCQVVYRAGYEATSSYTIAADDEGNPLPYTPDDQGQWTKNFGVISAGGITYVQVDDDPVAGQYTVDEWGVYGFAKDDVGVTVLVDYSFVPWDLSQAVLEMIGETFRRKDRIGVLSKTLAGQETVTFDRSGMSDALKLQFQAYLNVVPV
jgi:hypothetical protein